jgi:hypothetical protein
MTLLVAALIFRLFSAGPPQSNLLSSFQAFQKATTVLRHPRCLNCHVPGDSPLFETGASAQPHAMRVKRGPDGGGTAVMRCNTCHQETNAEVLHGPPGSKEWRLPSPKAKMAWLGLNDRDLCRAIADMKTNGGMSRENLAHHMETDPRVAWAWNPGPGRDTPPMSQREFVSLIRTWIEKGASCGQ